MAMTTNTDSLDESAGAEWAWQIILSARELVRSWDASAASARFTADAYGRLQQGGAEPHLHTLDWHRALALTQDHEPPTPRLAATYSS
jgi:hypothetical protein